MQWKNEVTIVFWFFHKPKNDKNILFNGGLLQQVLLTWNENLCERSKKIEVEDRIQKIDGEDEETVLDFLAQYEVYGCLKKWLLVCYSAAQGTFFFRGFYCVSVHILRLVCRTFLIFLPL